MSRLSDLLSEIEFDLAKNDGDDESAAFSRRIVLRKALTEWGDERFQEGYSEGRRDMSDARMEAKRRTDMTAETFAPTAGKD
jgi:hypothetical protein